MPVAAGTAPTRFAERAHTSCEPTNRCADAAAAEWASAAVLAAKTHATSERSPSLGHEVPLGFTQANAVWRDAAQARAVQCRDTRRGACYS